MRTKQWIVGLIAVAFIAVPLLSFAAEGERQGPTEDTLDKLLRESKSDKPAKKAEEKKDAKDTKGDKEAPADAAATAAPAAPAAPPAPAQPQFGEDSRKLSVTIKMKNGKSYKGVVKQFLAAEKIVDHSEEPVFSLSEGPTVQYQTDEFIMDWSKIQRVEFNKKNKENGEISCVDVTDVSPDRKECIMANEFVAFSNEKDKKGEHLIRSKDWYRFVIKSGGSEFKVDSHLGDIKVSNERDEGRQEKELAKELNEWFKNEILSMEFN